VNKFDLFSDGNPRNAERLLERHKRIVDANNDAITGKSVLDIAANNGRWSFAAIEAGATNVVSIEGREDRVAVAHEIFEKLGFRKRIKTNTGDMYEWLRENRGLEINTILCLGIFYHVMDHYMLLKYMTAFNPETMIIDSCFVRSFRNSVHIKWEDPNLHTSALPMHQGQKREIVGVVSLGLMIQMAWNLGYNCRPVPWNPAEVKFKSPVHDYLIGRRFTVRLDKMSDFADQNWKAAWKDTLRLLRPEFEQMLDRATHDAQTDSRVGQPFKSMEFSIM